LQKKRNASDARKPPIYSLFRRQPIPFSIERSIKEALEQNTFFYIYGKKTKGLCSKMARMCGAKHMLACSSGSAAGRFGASAQQSRAGEEHHE